VLIYWIMFSILASGALLSAGADTRRSWLLFIALASIPTTLMVGLRWEIGPDWRGYSIIFGYTRLFSLDQSLTHSDPGFFTLMWGIHRFGWSLWTVNFVCALIFVAGLTAFARRQPNSWLAFLVAFPYLVIVIGMSGDRQSVALGLLFFAFNAFERGRLLGFALLLLVGALFHGSVILMLPLCLLSYTQNALQRIVLLAGGAVLGYYFSRDAFSIYALRYSTDALQSTGVAFRLAMNALAAILFLLFHRRFDLEIHQHTLWRNISFCSLALIPLLIVFPSSTAIDRFLLYLFPLQFVVLSRLPKALSAERQSLGQLTLAIIGYAALVQAVFLSLGKFASFYVPYRSIFGA
jgi:hypothetical protein